MLPSISANVFPFKLYRYVQKHVCKYIYIYIIPMGYIEYKIDNFRLKHLPESVKKPIHRIKTSSGIGKNNICIEYFRLSILIQENKSFQVFDRSMDCCSRLWFKPVPQRDNCDFSMESVLQRVLLGQSRGEQWKKTYFAMKTNGNGWCSSKNWWIFSLGTYVLCM